MKKVQCINTIGYTTLTYSKVYYIFDKAVDDGYIRIRNDSGRLYDYPKHLFLFSNDVDKNLGQSFNDGFAKIEAEKKHVPSLAYQLESAQNKIKMLEAELAEYKPVKTGNLIADSLDEIDLGEQNEAARQLRESLMMCGSGSFEIVEGGTLNCKGLYLCDYYDWEIIRDNNGDSILVIADNVCSSYKS